jgi:peroxiredoxin
MKAWIKVLGGVVCVLAVVLAVVWRQDALAKSAFALQDPRSGEEVRVETGAPVLHLVFFAIWCPPCQDELRALGDLSARWSERGYRLVLVGVKNRQSAERLARFMSETTLPGEMLYDADGSVQSRLGAEQLPTHILFDGAGRELLRAGGLDEGVAEAIETALEQADRSSGGRR